MSNQIGLVNAFNELCDKQVTFIQRDSFIPVFRRKENDNIVEKLLVDNLLSGGSSSTIKNVIIINPDEDEVVGKVYHSFSDAKNYIDRNVNSSVDYPIYKIELPAGDFNEQVTMSKHYEIHGNSTNLITPINSEITLVIQYDVDFSNYNSPYAYLKDCIISAGFESNYNMMDTATEIPIYTNIVNCAVKRIDDGDKSDFIAYALFKFINCNIDVNEYGANTGIEAADFINCNVTNFSVGIGEYINFNNCNNINLSSNNADINFNNCIFKLFGDKRGELRVNNDKTIVIINSVINSMDFYTGENGKFAILNSTYGTDVDINVYGTGTIYANPLSVLSLSIKDGANDYRCFPIMFADNDHGKDMVQIPDPNWEITYIGFCKDFSAYDATNDETKYWWQKI